MEVSSEKKTSKIQSEDTGPEFNQCLDFYLQKIFEKNKNKQILIMGDDLFSFHQLKHILEDSDSEVTCLYARTPEQALKMIEATQCELLVAEHDVKSRFKALEACNVIKNSFPKMQIALLTNTNPERLRSMARKHSCITKFFHQPVYPKKFWNFIQKHFQRAEAIQDFQMNVRESSF